MSKGLVSILIPIYKEIPDENELISLNQCCKILGHYPIRFVAPFELNTEYYENICLNIKDLKIERFENSFFENVEGYNKLMLSLNLYKRFTKFEYILIYQLDCFVFRDELDYWCKQGYDYIGAPWINSDLYKWFQYKPYPRILINYHKLFGKGKYLNIIGNGGFSLRRISTTLFNLKIFYLASLKWKANEDSFFSHYIKTFNPFYQIAPLNEALKFSFDALPEKAFEMNNRNLPFGCHAFWREDTCYINNYSFWKSVI